MAAELQRSQFARETLEASTRELSALSERYTNLDTLLSSSKSLVGTLINSRKSDTWYLETTLYMLLATIAWLVFRRILYGPGWWLIWLPVRFVWWVLWTVVVGPIMMVFGAKVGNGAGGITLGGNSSASGISVIGEILSTGIVGVNSRGIPTFRSDTPRASVAVGGGGHGAKAEEASSEGDVVEQVGQMAERSQQEARGVGEAAEQRQHEPRQGAEERAQGEGTVLRERTAEDGPPNPKKRMWEEPSGDTPQSDRPRDEL